ncbi:toxin-antitoxin system YwqK family antitoxin [Marinifilum sp. D714]|uniref:toxin-antitoxin system YwqK family antitoxin n=1 Tax=Marinifilum sp. D714 TaxID=2937523 RepID=UPI0027CA4ECD|nr:hypothetical protein [Marinifilum sp. D714]MDQ2180406.1 hypothetical protein [Marinifilum sp. D714]
MKIFLTLISILFLFSCNCDKSLSSKFDCKNVLIDEQLEALANYNKDFYDENYSGEVISYFDNNDKQIEWKLYYKNGEIIKYESFHGNGDPKIVMPVKCNAEHGIVTVYMNQGKIAYEIEYKLGHKDGIGKSYYENGKIHKLVRFENDKKHGKQYEFSIEGDTILIEKYEHGKKLK